jgi:hypothetical protein
MNPKGETMRLIVVGLFCLLMLVPAFGSGTSARPKRNDAALVLGQRVTGIKLAQRSVSPVPQAAQAAQGAQVEPKHEAPVTKSETMAPKSETPLTKSEPPVDVDMESREAISTGLTTAGIPLAQSPMTEPRAPRSVGCTSGSGTSFGRRGMFGYRR